jgi:hypothetical protein
MSVHFIQFTWYQTDILTPTLGTGQNHLYTSKSILTSSTKHKTPAKAKRKPPETDIIDFGEETKNTKRLKQQASRAATDRG